MDNGEFSSVLEAQQTQSELRDVLNYQTVGMYEQQPRQRHVYNPYGPALIFKSIADLDPDLYVQKEPGENFRSNEQLSNLQRSYTFLTDTAGIAEVLAQVPPLYSLLNAAVEPLRVAFGDRKLLLLEALTSDDDTVLRVIVKLSQDTETPAALMRKFKLKWWFKNCSRSEASLVFDYEIGNGF
jgi:hypothetical protein